MRLLLDAVVLLCLSLCYSHNYRVVSSAYAINYKERGVSDGWLDGRMNGWMDVYTYD